ncbi:MAG TPA: 50S ribosomal protein L13 [Anaerolineae bacterium]|nr:50S ribosomal protein L13 [Anaerolineae bacterium]
MSTREETHIVKTSDIEREWFVVDADGQNLGRLASNVARILRGKHKAIYTPHLDVGDYVIVVNAEKIAVTGNKMDDKIYYRHTGYPGGLRSATLRQQLVRHPTFAITAAIKGMLPKNRLGRRMLRKLKVYAGPGHPHQAQEPKPLEF